MAMPKNISENEKLTETLETFIKSESTKSQFVNFWIGVRRIGTDNWLWNGTDLCFTATNYPDGEPWADEELNSSGNQSQRNCTVMKVRLSLFSELELNIIFC